MIICTNRIINYVDPCMGIHIEVREVSAILCKGWLRLGLAEGLERQGSCTLGFRTASGVIGYRRHVWQGLRREVSG